MPSTGVPPAVSFSVFKTSNSAGAQEAMLVSGGSWFKQRKLVQTAVLVQHPQGSFLFDTGLGRHVDQQFAANGWLDKQFFAYEAVDPVANQLERAAWPKERVRFIVPSHMHWDHVSGLDDFPSADILITETELEHARRGHAPGFLQSQFAGDRRWKTLQFDGPAYMGFAKSHDVFGDGAVVLVPMAGHTAGQVGMFLNLPSGQHYLFTGDVSWTIEGMRWPADRSWLLRQVLHVDDDEAANQACIVRVHRLMQRFPDLHVVPAHDENVYQTLPHFPSFQS